jgi:excisionase family DNA binding protein
VNVKQTASINLNRRRRHSYPAWLTAKQAADFIGVHPNTVYEYCKQGQLPHLRLGTAVMIDRDGLFLLAREAVRKQEKQPSDPFQELRRRNV